MAKTMHMKFNEIDRFFGGLKFAVILLISFAIVLATGTIIESYCGSDFAGRLLYKSWPFFILLGALYVCVFMAALLRLPPQKRLYGFYTVHAGLVLMLLSSFVTYYAGIDGSLTLPPMEPTRNLALNTDELAIRFPEENREITFELPFTALAKNLDVKYENITLKQFLPFSENLLQWLPSPTEEVTGKYPSSHYHLQNSFIGQDVVMSLHPLAPEFPSEQSLGPLTVYYYPSCLSQEIKNLGKSQLIVLNFKTLECGTPEKRKIPIRETSKKNRFFIFKDGATAVVFFPDFSLAPLTMDFQQDLNSPWRVINIKQLTEKPHLFLLGKEAMFYQDQKWQLLPLKMEIPIDLPWMGFQLTLKTHEEEKYPANVPYFAWPLQQGGRMLKGDQRAVEIEIAGAKKNYTFWTKNHSPTQVKIDNKTIEVELRKKNLPLPFELTLNHFKMDQDPGTNNPASYESFVDVFDPKGSSPAHIFMNNPLKKNQFTFYQASYFETDQGYGSVLSVNYDPGRWGKYLAALLIIFGSAWHFYLRRKNS